MTISMFSSGFLVAMAFLTPSVDGFSPVTTRSSTSQELRRLETKYSPGRHTDDSETDLRNQFVSRGSFFRTCSVALAGALAAPREAKALASYSSNARNMERLSSGDSSGGSAYDNNPKTEAGKRRRAMTGCKSPTAREETTEKEKGPSLSETDCNRRVLEGDSEFMLQALRELDCPTCPYGIATSR
jgi:hypothetical protein